MLKKDLVLCYTKTIFLVDKDNCAFLLIQSTILSGFIEKKKRKVHTHA